MKPNRSFDPSFNPEKDTDKGGQAGGFYRVPHAGPFIYATNRPEDGFRFIRAGFPVEVFHAKRSKDGKQAGAMMQAREHAAKNIEKNPLSWKTALKA